MARDVFIFVNGILTRPGDSKGWTDKAVHWFNRRAPGVACYPFEYYSPALLRFMFQRGHAIDLAETIAEYPGERIHLVGHSNGCDLIRRAILMTGAPIASVHFISGAVDRDFRRNGLADRLEREQIGEVFCLCSKGDLVLKYLAPTSRYATLGVLGYGDLGYQGATPALPRVRHVWRNRLGHGDWFSPEQFELTMETVFVQASNPSLALA